MPRYIDAERFKLWVQDNYVLYDGDRYLKDIDAQPTADVVERKKGKWARDEFGSKCSYCGLYAYRDKFEKPWESNFCPFCGCAMEGEEDDEDN